MSRKLMVQHFGDLFIARNNVIAARITNYLFQDDEEKFDDLFQMKYNLVAALLYACRFFLYSLSLLAKVIYQHFESKKLSLILIVKDGHTC